MEIMSPAYQVSIGAFVPMPRVSGYTSRAGSGLACLVFLPRGSVPLAFLSHLSPTPPASLQLLLGFLPPTHPPLPSLKAPHSLSFPRAASGPFGLTFLPKTP